MAISMLLDALGDTKELEHLHTKIITSSHSHELTAFLDALECIGYVISLTNGDLKPPQKKPCPHPSHPFESSAAKEKSDSSNQKPQLTVLFDSRQATRMDLPGGVLVIEQSFQSQCLTSTLAYLLILRLRRCSRDIGAVEAASVYK